MSSQDQDQPWHTTTTTTTTTTIFPAPTRSAETMPKQRAMQILSMKIASLLIVDVRGTDYAGGCIRSSLNIPARGLWWNRGALYELAYKADVEWVVFACSGSSSDGGGGGESESGRCAGWFLDHVRGLAGDEDMQVLVLEGGVEGWVRGGAQFTRLMDGFREEYWRELFEKEEELKEG